MSTYLFLATDKATGDTPPFGLSEGSLLRAFDTETCTIARDWEIDWQIEEEAGGSVGVIVFGCPLAAVDTMFRLRAIQIDQKRAFRNVPSLVFISDDGVSPHGVPGLKRRILSSWPFASVIFVADGQAARLLTEEGLPVVSCDDAAALGYAGLLHHPDRLCSQAVADQKVGVHVQALWRMCGSTTAFANQTESLADEGLFVIRVFISENPESSGIVGWMKQLSPDNRTFMGPHLESIACTVHSEENISHNAYQDFVLDIGRRATAEIADSLICRLVCRGVVAVVNHTVNVVFALRAMPDAKIVLDTHDYVTRWALERAKKDKSTRAFPDKAVLRLHAKLERDLWRASDACCAPSESETVRVLRYTPKCIFILPRPYVRRWVCDPEAIEWDVLIAADGHPFNLEALEYFLCQVVEPQERVPPLADRYRRQHCEHPRPSRIFSC